MFSFGKNLVTNLDDTTKYFRKLKNNLQVLNMEDNPYNYAGQTDRDYKFYTICALKQLQYLDYSYIGDDQRKKADAKFSDIVNEAEAAAKDGENKPQETEKGVDEELVLAHIAITDHIMDKFHEGDVEGKVLELLKAHELWADLQEAQDEPTQKYQKFMKDCYKERKSIIDYCTRELKKAAALAEKTSIQLIRDYQKYRKRMRNDMEAKGEERGDEDEYGEELKAELTKLQGRLMDVEMGLK